MLSPSLFNIYLDEALRTRPTLVSLIDEGKLIAFADDIIVMASSRTEAEAAIDAMNSLDEFGLHLNKNKTKIMTDNRDSQDIPKIRDIDLSTQMRYLGMDLVCERPKLISLAKKRYQKFMGLVRGKIQARSSQLSQFVLSAYYRSLMVYYLTPIYAAGAMDRSEINNFEAGITRQQYLIPNDITNDAVRAIGSNFTEYGADVIIR